MKVLVAIDGSEASHAALERAINLVNHYDGDLAAITIVHLSGFYFSALALPTTSATESDIEAAIVAAVWKTVEERLAEVEGPVELIDGRGHAGEEICDAARRIDADIIVVGNRGFGPVRASFLGSTSRYVSQHAPCDVLIVRAPDQSEITDAPDGSER